DKIGTDIEVNFKEHLLGHKVHYSSKVYKQYTENINKYFSLWKLIEMVLCIDYKIKDVTDEKIVEIRKDNQSLKNQIDILVKENSEIVERLNNLTKAVKEISKFRERGGKIQEIQEALKKLT
ncbi:unnamed protein product, partial [marine sediment metagenome]